ncbi:MAG: thermonuclease family protein [Pseudomonadota bacterium]
MTRLVQLPNVLLACVLLVFCCGSLQAKTLPEVRVGVVTRVVDGDTLWVRSDNVLLKVRVTGIDAPEICQSWGVESREALKRRALGQPVTVTYQRFDDYGRLLGRVDLGNEDLGRWMVSQGHAWSYAYRNYPGAYAAEQRSAMDLRLGLFAQAAPEVPRQFRKRHGSCFP